MADFLQLQVTVMSDGTGPIVAVRGDIDVASSPELWMRLSPLLGNCRVILDLGGVTYMDSSGIRVLETAHCRSIDCGGTLVIQSVPSIIRRVLEITGCDKVLNVE